MVRGSLSRNRWKERERGEVEGEREENHRPEMLMWIGGGQGLEGIKEEGAGCDTSKENE